MLVGDFLGMSGEAWTGLASLVTVLTFLGGVTKVIFRRRRCNGDDAVLASHADDADNPHAAHAETRPSARPRRSLKSRLFALAAEGRDLEALVSETPEQLLFSVRDRISGWRTRVYATLDAEGHSRAADDFAAVPDRVVPPDKRLIAIFVGGHRKLELEWAMGARLEKLQAIIASLDSSDDPPRADKRGPHVLSPAP